MAHSPDALQGTRQGRFRTEPALPRAVPSRTVPLSRATLELWDNAGAGSLLFYPGTMLSPLQYRPLLQALHRSGFAVAALHLTGHGVNRHNVGFAFDDLLRDGLEAEKWLADAGRGPVAVCGHSQGGILALAHAAASPTLAAALPVSAVLPQTDAAVTLTRFAPLAAHRKKIQAIVHSVARLLPRLPLPLQSYLSARRIMAGARRCVTSRAHARLTYPLVFLDSLFSARVSHILRCPLCLFSARDDALFTPHLTENLFAHVLAPMKKLVWLPGGGHLAVMNPPLCRFVARHAAAFCAGLGLPVRLFDSGANDGL